MSLADEIRAIGETAKSASMNLVSLDSAEKNEILRTMAKGLEEHSEEILRANAIDVECAVERGLSPAMCDRLRLDAKRISQMVSGIRSIVELDDPVGRKLESTTRPNGLVVEKTSVPIGVVGFIYESRPNVTADAAALCLKSSNAVILKGGSEALHSNRAIVEAIGAKNGEAFLPDGAVRLIESTDREAVKELVQLVGLVDLIIPRGGEGLIRTVADLARVPVLKHYKGVCHVYVDSSADTEMALSIVENAKCQRPGVCNAMETLLVDKEICSEFLPRVCSLLRGRGVELRGDDVARREVSGLLEAVESDWHEEYLTLILSIKVVDGVKGAVEHISRYGSGHSDAIVAECEKTQEYFVTKVDSASVLVNASTRFVDGGEFGMGAEIGISTDKLHARGPMGLRELTTYKYVVRGRGQVRI